jgi:hypothetical protein
MKLLENYFKPSDEYRIVYDPVKSDSGSSYLEVLYVYKNGVLCEIITTQR